jgi:FkbM family methyltransferase
MTFVSHAQNLEDVMLWRALKHVKKGFYIDVGAWSPDQDSVTKSFYEAGWSGMNIEPNPTFHRQLQAKRPRDLNIKMAVGEYEGEIILNLVENTGLTTVNDEFAKKHAEGGWKLTREPVKMTTLRAICLEYLSIGKEIHFLKIDVEGLEKAVLRGNDWSKNRPWIVIAESTLPLTQVESHIEWEQIILDANYEHAYSDGLNRFYVSHEHKELLKAFRFPPNIHDGYVLIRQIEAEKKAQQAEARARQAEIKAQEAANQSAATRRELTSVYMSSSWRITKPMRWCMDRIIANRQLGALTIPKQIIKHAVRHGNAISEKHPRLKGIAINIASQFGLANWLRRLYWGEVSTWGAAYHKPFGTPKRLSEMSSRGQTIYMKFKQEIKKSKKEHGR